MPRAVSTPRQTCGPSAPTRQLSHHCPFKRPDSGLGGSGPMSCPCLAACLCACLAAYLRTWQFRGMGVLTASATRKIHSRKGPFCLFSPQTASLFQQVLQPTAHQPRPLPDSSSRPVPNQANHVSSPRRPASDKLATQWSRPPWTGPGSGWPTHWLDGSSTTISTRPDSATAAPRRLHPTNSAALAVTAGRPLLPGLKSSYTARASLHAARIRCVRRLVLAHERLRLQAGGACNAWPRRTTKPALPAHLPPTHEACSLESAGRVPIKVIGLHRAS